MNTDDRLTKQYGRATPGNDVTFPATPGRVTGSPDPNGAGKSTTVRMTPDRSAAALPTSWQRLPAPSGIVFAVLFVVGFLISGSDAPDYSAADQVWTNWAQDNEVKGRIGALLTLLAAFAFLHFAAMIRGVLGSFEGANRGSVHLARVVFAGGLTGVTGITMAVIMIAGATAEGADANPMVTKAVASTTVGPFLVGAMGFAASLAAAGLVILRSRVFARWIAIVALLGGLAFFVTFFTLIAGPSKDSIFGYGFFPGFLALTIWSIATSIASYRAAPTVAGQSPATGADS
jgi:Domain of unknown function (DUF4386)